MPTEPRAGRGRLGRDRAVVGNVDVQRVVDQAEADGRGRAAGVPHHVGQVSSLVRGLERQYDDMAAGAAADC